MRETSHIHDLEEDYELSAVALWHLLRVTNPQLNRLLEKSSLAEKAKSSDLSVRRETQTYHQPLVVPVGMLVSVLKSLQADFYTTPSGDVPTALWLESTNLDENFVVMAPSGIKIIRTQLENEDQISLDFSEYPPVKAGDKALPENIQDEPGFLALTS